MEYVRAIDRLIAPALVWLLASCQADETPGPAAALSVAVKAAAVTASDTAAATAKKFEHGLPAVPLSVESGQRALAPGRAGLEEALSRGFAEATLAYYAVTVATPGEALTEVRDRLDRVYSVPSVLVIPLPRAERAAPGQWVLTAWRTGAGLQRALVVPGGRPESPNVRYVDLPLDSPSPADKPELLDEGSFRRLAEPMSPGTTLICQRDGGAFRALTVQRVAQHVYALALGGRLEQLPVGECRPVRFDQGLAAGASVYVPLLGQYTRGSVTKVEHALGRVRVKYEIGVERAERSFAAIDVAGSKTSEQPVQ